jgi:hypothetical protein
MQHLLDRLPLDVLKFLQSYVYPAAFFEDFVPELYPITELETTNVCQLWKRRMAVRRLREPFLYYDRLQVQYTGVFEPCNDLDFVDKLIFDPQDGPRTVLINSRSFPIPENGEVKCKLFGKYYIFPLPCAVVGGFLSRPIRDSAAFFSQV